MNVKTQQQSVLILLSSWLISPLSAYTAPPPPPPPKPSGGSTTAFKTQQRRTFISKIASGALASTFTLAYPDGASAIEAAAAANEDMSVPNYIRQVFGSPLVGATPNPPTNPTPIDAAYDTREARNRAYDEAFQQDARDRDAYYGQMAMRKRQETEQNVRQYRESLGLDGKGDVRMRVGEERVQGLASLRELKADYLASLEEQKEDDDSSQTIVETAAE